MIKVGEYIRTVYGDIMKVNKINSSVLMECVKNNGSIKNLLEEEIKTHSRHLSDLVERNDIVNGHKVVQVNNFLHCEKEIYTNICIDNISYCGIIPNTEVNEILTHEQYEQNCYIVKEEQK